MTAIPEQMHNIAINTLSKFRTHFNDAVDASTLSAREKEIAKALLTAALALQQSFGTNNETLARETYEHAVTAYQDSNLGDSQTGKIKDVLTTALEAFVKTGHTTSANIIDILNMTVVDPKIDEVNNSIFRLSY